MSIQEKEQELQQLEKQIQETKSDIQAKRLQIEKERRETELKTKRKDFEFKTHSRVDLLNHSLKLCKNVFDDNQIKFFEERIKKYEKLVKTYFINIDTYGTNTRIMERENLKSRYDTILNDMNRSITPLMILNYIGKLGDTQ